MTLSIIMRLLTLCLIFVSRAYWFFKKNKALRDKPKSKEKPITFEKLGIIFFGAFLVVNLFGYTIFPFKSVYFQVFGFILVALGFIESMLGRKELATNWTESYNYQIKKKHELVTTRIYSQVRHPIYGGLWLTLTGVFIVSETYLFLPISLLSLLLFIKFAKREEKILIKHFGKKYIKYQLKTKLLIPTIY
jgi:protein-S-isoprenylcysteine O-methyltransferase Ste14